MHVFARPPSTMPNGTRPTGGKDTWACPLCLRRVWGLAAYPLPKQLKLGETSGRSRAHRDLGRTVRELNFGVLGLQGIQVTQRTMEIILLVRAS